MEPRKVFDLEERLIAFTVRVACGSSERRMVQTGEPKYRITNM
jgi:hypothetical protein